MPSEATSTSLQEYLKCVREMVFLESSSGTKYLALKNFTIFAMFRESFRMGAIELTQSEIDSLMVDLGGKYRGRSYNLLLRNCNHFTEELVRLLCDKPIPSWINRLAHWGRIIEIEISRN